MKRNHRIALGVYALTAALLVGCGAKNSAEVTAAPLQTAAPAATAAPVATAAPIETSAPVATPLPVPHPQPGDRYPGSVTMDGMPQTVQYEQIRSDALGFEMGYNYERFERQSEPGRERFVLIGEDPARPEVYLEITRRSDTAESAAASIAASLSDVYNPSRGEYTLDRAGRCLTVHADVDKNNLMSIDELQSVYLFPAADGCLVAWTHNTMDSADAFGALYRGMLNTLAVLDTHDPIVSAPAAQAPTAQDPAAGQNRFTGVMGTEFVVPEGFIQLDESPNIGYQYTFWHPDTDMRIVVYEIAPGAIPEGAYETDLSTAQRNPDVTYFNAGDDWFVQSGYEDNGNTIFYSKECRTDTGLKYFWITYPTSMRDFGDKTTAEFEANLSF